MIASLVHLGVQVLGSPTEAVEGTIETYVRSLRGGPRLEVLTSVAGDADHGHEHATR